MILSYIKRKILTNNRKSIASPSDFHFFITHLESDVKCKVIFDIGAHVGKVATQLLQVFPYAELYAFEPSSKAYYELANQFRNDNRIFCYNMAMGNRCGSAMLNLNIFDETNSVLPSNGHDTEISHLLKTVERAEVQLITLDEFCVQHNIDKIDLLKIDAQGFTYEILEGAHFLLKENRIKHIYAEVEYQQLYKNEKLFTEIEELLNGFDYRLEGTYNLNLLKNRPAWADAHFVRND
jgi:FkbM family methyltransferase